MTHDSFCLNAGETATTQDNYEVTTSEVKEVYAQHVNLG
jgi:hypothetical protein